MLEASIDEVYRRIAAHAENPVFLHVPARQALLARAKAIEAIPRGPLWGKLLAVKDNIDVAGMPTTAACPAYSYVPSRSAFAVERLERAGAIVVGKTNLDQFATGLVGTRSPHGAVRNAFRPEFISGGSSSGSAVAVALGMADFALGTDTAGSGRVPAAFNAVVGLKPTHGLVSTRGVVPACHSLDCVSVFSRTCAEALDAFRAMRGTDPQDPYSRTGSPAGIDRERFRFAVPSALEFHGDAGYQALFARSLAKLESLGGRRGEIDFAPFLEAQSLLYGPWVAERTAVLEKHLGDMLPVTRSIIESGRRYSAAELFRAQHRLAELHLQCMAALEGFDVLVVPGAPTIYRISEVEAKPVELNSRLGRYTNFVNLLDLAAITVPAGVREDGVPFGVTLIGRPFSDEALAALGARFCGEPDLPSAQGALRLAVVGAHLSGMALNHQLVERGARLVRAARTAPSYRLFALEGKPGMLKVAEGGASIELEVWEMAPEAFASFVSLIPAPLGIGTVSLEDGEQVKGFLCEHYGVAGRKDITSYGGWRNWLASGKG
ncbi:MAG: allophanate hydrolase [Betaproteobacteria bacterium]|nr:allophanate hydrolase [Betaproteobacteria bacterium]